LSLVLRGRRTFYRNRREFRGGCEGVLGWLQRRREMMRERG